MSYSNELVPVANRGRFLSLVKRNALMKRWRLSSQGCATFQDSGLEKSPKGNRHTLLATLHFWLLRQQE